jgi:AcrR family transcriptional regulator
LVTGQDSVKPETPPPGARERILQTSLDLFLAAGVDGTSVAEICRAAGVSNGSFFHHFPNKEELALELTLRLRREYWEYLLAALEPETDAMIGVEKIIRAAFEYQRRCPERYRFSRSDDAPWMRDNAQRARDDNAPYRGRAARWIGAQAAVGKLPVLTPEIYGALLFGTPHWVARNANAGAQPTDFDAVADELVRTIKKALSV